MSTGTAIWRLRYALVFLLVAGVYWPTGFYAFNPTPLFANNAVIASDETLQFSQRGIAYVDAPPPWLDAAIVAGRVDLTLDVRTASRDQERAIIFALGNGIRERNFSIGQHQNILVVSHRRFDGVEYSTKAYYIPKVFRRTGWQSIRVTLTNDRLTVTHGDNRRWERELGSSPFNEWLPDARISLGNTLEFGHPWAGAIRTASIEVDGHTYDYLNPQTLELPRQYSPVFNHSLGSFLSPPAIDYSPGQIRDWLVNFFGFFPLAALAVVLWRGNMPITAALLICLITSLSIELTQILLPWRTPSIHDLILNTAGGWVGALIVALILHLLDRKRQARKAPGETRPATLKNV